MALFVALLGGAQALGWWVVSGLGVDGEAPVRLLARGWIIYGGLVLGLFVLGLWSAGRMQIEVGCADDPRIVIDEVVGQLLALAPIPLLLPRPDPIAIALAIVTAFVLFRVFDIAKPGVVGWVDHHLSGGLGVMVDDVMAGLLAAGVLAGLEAMGQLAIGRGWLFGATGGLA